MIRLASLCLWTVVLIGCSEKPVPPPQPLPANQTPAQAESQPQTPTPAVPVTTQQAAPVAGTFKDGVTVITPEIIQEKFYTLHDAYPGQTLEVTGTVQDVDLAVDGRSSVQLKSETRRSLAEYCPIDEQEVWSRCAPGQMVTMRGQVEQLDVLTRRIVWKVVNVQSPAPPVLTSIALAKEFTDHDSRASADYADQWFYLTGEIVSVDKWRCYLKSDGATEIRVDLPEDGLFPPNPFLRSPAYQVGKPLTVLVKCDADLHEPGCVNLDGIQITVPFPIAETKYAAAIVPASERLVKLEQAMTTAQPDFTISSNQEFVTETKADESAASLKYDGKIAEVTGTIDRFDTKAVRLEDELDLHLGVNLRSVRCLLVTANPWKDYQKGQAATVRGRLDGRSLPDLKLTDAVVVKSEPPIQPRVAVTPEELVQKVAAKGKYKFDAWKDQEFIITGKIHKVTVENAYSSQLQLDAGASGIVYVNFSDADHAKFIKLAKRQPGETIRVLGEVQGWSPEEKYIEIGRAWILN